MALANKKSAEVHGLIPCCPSCETKYGIFSAKLLAENNGMYLVHVNCKKCRTSILALVTNNQLGSSSFCLVTDLNSEESLLLKDKTSVHLDEVLNLHELLNSKKFLKTLTEEEI